MSEPVQVTTLENIPAVSVSVGARKVISSGSIIVGLDEEVTLKVASLTFVISFTEDGEKGRLVYETDKETKTLRIAAYNFATPTGAVTSSPPYVGNVAGQKLYLAIAARRFMKEHTGSCLLSYTFTLGA